MKTANKKAEQKGFTLIELLAVIAIVGILATIAIYQYRNYWIGSCNATAQSDLRNAALAQEAYYNDNEKYTNVLADLTGPYGLSTSENVVFQNVQGDTTDYYMEAYHSKGNRTYLVDGPGGAIAIKP